MDITYSVKKNVAVISINVQNKSVNTFDPKIFSALKKAIITANNTPDIQGLIIHSDKEDFCYGVDVQYIQKLAQKAHEQQFKTLTNIHAIFQILATGKPSVSILNGQCLGGGLELALATQYRIGVQGTNLRIGLPEAKIGIIPGLGGTQRLPRLIGIESALSMLLKGHTLNIDKALQQGLINHASKFKRHALSEAIQWISKAQLSQQKNCQPFSELPIFSAAIALAKKTTQGCYPHIESLLQAVYEGGQVNLETALQIETHQFIKVLNHQQTNRMLQTLFTDRIKLKRSAKSHAATYPMQHIGIVGGGFMGSAIAAHAMSQNISVTIIEQKDQIQACNARVQALIAQYPIQHRSKLKVSQDYKSLSQCHLIIEAVYEDITLKQQVLKTIEEHAKSDAIIASNTSSIPISELGKSLSNPKRFVGIHFFSPVAKMPLIEIIQGKQTKQVTIHAAQSLSHHFRKTPILVKDTPGFYTTNIAMAYARSALKLLDQGVPPYLIERAAKRIGMPTPPLKLMDEIGIDVIWGIIQAQKLKQPSYIAQIKNLYDMKRLGRKSNAGFYDYQSNRSKLWPNLLQNSKKSTQHSIEDIESTLFKQQIMVANNLLKSGIIDRPNANVGAILGLGFCPWSGGPISD